jgi:hypothetical protein
MSIGIFNDKKSCPDNNKIINVLGKKKNVWIEFIDFIRENSSKLEDLRFYGKNYGWALRFRKNNKVLISLYPSKDSFIAQIILGKTESETALKSSLDMKIKKIIEGATEFKEGRWLFIPVKNRKDIKDVKYLLSLKINS